MAVIELGALGPIRPDVGSRRPEHTCVCRMDEAQVYFDFPVSPPDEAPYDDGLHARQPSDEDGISPYDRPALR